MRVPKTWANSTSGYASGPVGYGESGQIVRADQAAQAGFMRRHALAAEARLQRGV